MLNFSGIKVTKIRSKIPYILAVTFFVLLLIPFILPSSFYKGFIENRLEQSTGFEFNFNGDFTFSLLPNIRMEADNLDFLGKTVGDVETVGFVQKVTFEMNPFEFLVGDIHINEFELYNPKITINGDFTPYIPNWIRKNLQASHKQDIRYLEILLHFVEDSVFDSAKLVDGAIQWNKTPSTQVAVQGLNMIVQKPFGGKDFTTQADAYINDRSIDLSMRLERPDDFLRGFRSNLSFQVDSAPLRVEFNGNAAQRHSFVAQGDIRVDIPSVYDFCSWFSNEEECDPKRESILIKSHLKLRDQKLQIEDASYTHNPFLYTADGVIDFKRNLPEITGTILVPTRDVNVLLPSVKKLNKLDFTKLFLESFNADVDLKYQGLRLASGHSLQPNVNFNIKDGRINISLSQFKVFDGLVNARLRWNKGVDIGNADLRMDASSISIDAFEKALGMNLNVSGTLKMAMEFRAQGSTIEEILDSARTVGEFSVFDGTFSAPEVVEALHGEKMKRFEFAEMKGRIDGEKGRLRSDDINFVAAFIDVTGLAFYDLAAQTLKINLKSKIPELKNADGTIKSKAQEGFVNINGPINQLVMITSVNPDVAVPTVSGLHSGLISNSESTNNSSGSNDFIIEGADLLD